MMQALRFVVVGLLNTAIGLSCIFAAMTWFALDYRVANAVGYGIGAGVGFVLNRSWTFAHQGSWWGSLGRWVVVVGMSYGLNLLVVIVVHESLRIDAYLAQLAGVVAYTGAAFLGGRYFAFRAAPLAGSIA